MVGWHHRCNGHEFEWALGVGDGQGSLVCYSPWGHKESDTTERLNWTEGLHCCTRAFVSCGERGLLSIQDGRDSHCGGISCWGARALECVGFSSWGTRALLPGDMWDLPGPGPNPCPLHWQTDSQPLDHLGSHTVFFIFSLYNSQNQILDFLDWFPKYFKSFLPPPHFSYCFSFLYFLRDFTNFIFQVSMFLISTIIHFIFIFKSSALFSEYYFS